MSDPTLPRVVLLEDDLAFRRFVSMALETFSIDLVACASVQEARLALAVPTRLLLCDLRLPGESGRVLLEEQAALPAAPRTIVFSGGLDDAVRLRLAQLGVWRAVAKPCSLAELEGAVREALASHIDSEPASLPTPAPTAAGAQQQDQSAAVQEHFGGDHALYAEYAAFCRTQFLHDIRAGDFALQAGDLPVMRRLGHSLKTVLRTLGYPALADVAAQLESSAHDKNGSPTRQAWQTLSAGLQGLAVEA
jgi:CheY-like chemotaxis protein